ncbi:MAG: hypothetical protein FWH11_00675 [Micrococcales bacterium]|nr:hypothetical protein [Micrococcales bacterium]
MKEQVPLRPERIDAPAFLPFAPSKKLASIGRRTLWKLSQSRSPKSFRHIRERFWGKLPMEDQFDLFGIDGGGVAFWSAVVAGEEFERRVGTFTEIKKGWGFDTPMFVSARNLSGIVMDNSIHTGETALQALRSVSEVSVVRYFVKLVDYEDEAEDRAAGEIASYFPNVSLVSLYTDTELSRLAESRIEEECLRISPGS